MFENISHAFPLVSFPVSPVSPQPHKEAPTTKGTLTMKKTLYTLTILGGIASMAMNAYFINNAKNAGDALTECAREQNVFACKFEAVPVESPKVVYKTAELLPPPEFN